MKSYLRLIIQTNFKKIVVFDKTIPEMPFEEAQSLFNHLSWRCFEKAKPIRSARYVVTLFTLSNRALQVWQSLDSEDYFVQYIDTKTANWCIEQFNTYLKYWKEISNV